MYSATTSTSFSSKRGSLESLNVSTSQGFSSWLRHARAIVSFPTPRWPASVRVDQCVDSSGAVSCWVTRTISATVPSGNHDLRPRPLAIRPTPSTPSAANRRRHARTLTSVVAHRRATSFVPTPSAANNNALACTTLRCGNDVDRATFSNAARCTFVIGSGSAVITVMLPPYRPNLYQRRTTRRRDPTPSRVSYVGKSPLRHPREVQVVGG